MAAMSPKRQNAAFWVFIAVAAVVGGIMYAAISNRTPPAASPRAAVTAPTQTAPSSPRAAPRPSRVVAFGHSMPAGRGATDPDRSYVALVGADLNAPVENDAVSGAEMTDTLAVITRKPIPAPTELVIVHVGINDIDSRGRNTSLASDGQTVLPKMLDRLTAQGARVAVLSECRPVNWTSRLPPFDLGGPEAFGTWNRVVTAVTAKYPRATLITACTNWDPKANVDSSGYNPNDAGHALIAKAIEQAIQP